MDAPKLPPNPKWMSLDAAVERRVELREAGQRLVLTNGCFDLLHPGHLSFLQEARRQGDALVVALNSDASVQALKGSTRPVLSEAERAFALGALTCVEGVIVFREERLVREIKALRPDIYVKAGDYTLETLNQQERAALEAVGAEIRFLPFLPGYSTTNLIRKISAAAETF